MKGCNKRKHLSLKEQKQIEHKYMKIEQEKVEVTERWRNDELVEVKANGHTIFPKKDLEQEIMEMFDKGYYTFRFEYLDKDNKRRFSINSWNEGMSREDTLKEVYRFVDEHNGKLTDFVENEWVKSFISHIITLVQKDRDDFRDRILIESSIEIDDTKHTALIDLDKHHNLLKTK